MTENEQKAQLLDGTGTAAAIREDLAVEIKRFTDNGARQPGLAVLLIGDDPASHIYVKNKVAACKKAGIASSLFQFAANVPPNEVLAKIEQLNADEAIDGILVQLPLPSHLDTEQVLTTVSPEKDADGLHHVNMGLLATGKSGPRPCTPLGIITLLERYKVPIAGQNAVVIGRSNLVGKPVALMLLEKHATVTICHSKSANLDEIVRHADIVVAAAGKPHLVQKSWIKPGAVVVDVGIHRKTDESGQSKLIGDVDFEQVAPISSRITPVPGGIGPMTIAMLLSNTVNAYKKKLAIKQSTPVLK